MAALTDAIVVSQSMFASTIAEYFVEEDHVMVELEIGMKDLPAFRNLLPDSVFQKMGYSPEPVEDRLEQFFSRDMAITRQCRCDLCVPDRRLAPNRGNAVGHIQ